MDPNGARAFNAMRLEVGADPQRLLRRLLDPAEEVPAVPAGVPAGPACRRVHFEEGPAGVPDAAGIPVPEGEHDQWELENALQGLLQGSLGLPCLWRLSYP